MATDVLEPEPGTVHDHFSRGLPPALTIESGDVVVLRTLDSAWRSVSEGALVRSPLRDRGVDGHALCGPIAVRGAVPGATLEIRIDEVRPGSLGHVGAGGGEGEYDRCLNVAEGDRYRSEWAIDSEAGVAVSQHGQRIAIRPFLGVMGMPPPEEGRHPTGPPRVWGGNLDCKELVAGSTLYLPVPAPDGLLSVGDGHAVQGDGEVSGIGLECPMERVQLTMRVREDMRISTPWACTRSAWLTLGLHEDLGGAYFAALNAMLDLMHDRHGLERKEALALASLVVDMRITQAVNGVKGVHAVLPHGVLQT